jgi:hypothetical protein
MGTQFSWFYDLLVLAIFLGITFRCYKKGFVSSVVSLAAVAAAFIIALLLSGIIAPLIFNGVIRERAEGYIKESVGGMINPDSLLGLSDVDTSEILINGIPLSEINATPDSVGNINLDLGNVDLSNTGLDNLDLEFFGIDEEALASVNAGRAVITTSELAESDLETLVMAKVLASTIQQNGAEQAVLEEAARTVSDILPQISGDAVGNISNAVSRLIVTVLESADGGGSITRNMTAVLMDSLVTPLIMMPLRTLIFFLIFGIISVVLSFVARTLAIVNRIPIVGRLNSALGIVIGLLKSAVVVFLVCIGINILIMVTGNNIIFLNTMTIEESFVFKYIYNLRFISLG